MASSLQRASRAAARGAPLLALSVALHAAAWASLARAPAPRARERVEFEVVRRARTPPPAAAPEPPRPARRPSPAARRAVAAAPTLASAPQAPPPADAPRPLPRVGLSLGSTVAAGSFSVGVGNTVLGRADETAADPASVRPIAGPFVPAARLSAAPRPLDIPKIAYPPDARKAGIEGRVVLVLSVDGRGAVTAVRVLEAPGPSLAAAAAAGARRFRFSPGLAEGEPVATEIRFTYTFLLE